MLIAAALVGVAAGPDERTAPVDLVLTLSGPSTIELHSTPRFTISVRNEIFGPDVQAQVTVRLPSGMSYVEPPDATVQCSGRVGTVVCDVMKLPASFAFPIESALPRPAVIDARAEADVTDVRPENNADRATVEVYGLVFRRLRTTPARPLTGRRFVASVTLVRTDTGAAVPARRPLCPGSVGPTPLRGKATFGPARVSCAWLIPARPRGRFLRGAVVERRSSGYQPKLSFLRAIR